MALATGGESRALKSADDVLDLVCIQALEQVRFLQHIRIVHKHSLPIDPVLASFVGSDATEPILILNTFLQRDRQSGEQVGGSRLVNEYRAKYMSYTFAS